MATLLVELLVNHGWPVEVCRLRRDCWRLGTCDESASCRNLRTAAKRALCQQVAGVLQAH